MKNRIFNDKNSRALTEKEMDDFKMSEEEKQEVRNINAGVFKPVSKKELSRYKKTQADFRKNRTKAVLIRFDIDDLTKIKKKAEAEGLPYQTFIKSIIHKVVTH